MSLNQIITPVKPLNVVFNNITASNITGTEIIKLSDVGGSISIGDNVASSALLVDDVYIQNLGNLIYNDQTFKQKRYYSTQKSITTPITINPANQGIFQLILNDPSINTSYINSYKILVSSIGVVNDGSNNFVGSLYIDASMVSNGSVILKFVSQYGILLPNTNYRVFFDLVFYYQ